MTAHRATTRDVAQARALAADGATLAETARALGWSWDTMKRWSRWFDIDFPELARRCIRRSRRSGRASRR